MMSNLYDVLLWVFDLGSKVYPSNPVFGWFIIVVIVWVLFLIKERVVCIIHERGWGK